MSGEPKKIYGYIYRIYNPKLLTVNGENLPIQFSYIGRTEKTVSARFTQHKRDANKFKGGDKDGDGKLHAVMFANGINEFICEELAKAYSAEELSEMEKHYQNLYESIEHGWNKITASTINRLAPEKLTITLNGSLYKFSSLAHLCRELGISNSNVNHGIKNRNLTLEQAIISAIEARKKTDAKKNIPVIIFRVPYPTINDAVRDKKLNKYNLNEKTIRTRIKKGGTYEEVFTTPPKRGRNNELNISTPDGISHSFPSLAEAHRKLALSYKVPPYSSVQVFYKERGLTIEQAFGFTSRPWEMKYSELEELIQNKGYKFVGKKSQYGDPVILHASKEIFATVKEFAQTFGYNYFSIAGDIQKGLTADEILIKRKHPAALKST